MKYDLEEEMGYDPPSEDFLVDFTRDIIGANGPENQKKRLQWLKSQGEGQ